MQRRVVVLFFRSSSVPNCLKLNLRFEYCFRCLEPVLRIFAVCIVEHSVELIDTDVADADADADVDADVDVDACDTG